MPFGATQSWGLAGWRASPVAALDTAGGGGDVDPQALLDEAAVRFDFSEYDDIGAMLDVNGGWGPIESVHAGGSLTSDGLHFTGVNSWSVPPDGGPSPLTFDGDGLTAITVVEIPAAWETPVGQSVISNLDFYGNAAGNGKPALALYWTPDTDADPGPGTYDTTGQDASPNPTLLWNESGDALDIVTVGVGGVCLVVAVLDTAQLEMRFRLVGPSTSFGTAIPFLKAVPTIIASPVAMDEIDALTTVEGTTQVEWLAWNRVLSDAEVDALVAHFQA